MMSLVLIIVAFPALAGNNRDWQKPGAFSEKGCQAWPRTQMNYHYHLTRAVLLLSLSCFSAAAQPLIASFFPTAGAPGDSVTLIGSGFTTPGGIVVRFWQG